MKYLILISLLFMQCPSYENNNTKEKSVTNSIEINKDISIKLVSQIKEVIERDSLLRIKNNRKIIYLVESTPEENYLGHYWIKVCEDNGVSFVTHFNFQVNPLTKKVNFYDHINEKLLNLVDWRKTL